MSAKRSRVQFDEATHTYTLDGVELPSVTHIIRYLAVDKANNADPNMALIARERGSAVHEATVMYDYSGEIPDDFPVEYAPYLEAYVQFVRDYKPGWIDIEHVMGSSELGYAGTLDRFGVIDEEQAILDIKTSYKVDVPSLSAQLYAYEALLKSEKPALAKTVFNLYGLQLMRTGKYRLYKCDKYIGGRLFNHCQGVYKTMEQIRGVRYAVR
jgi:hypothetical protein